MNAKVTNSPIGVNKNGQREMFQMVTITIDYHESNQNQLKIELPGLRKKTSLAFYTESYLGTICEGVLELWNENGELLKSGILLEGKIIGVYDNLYIILNRNKKSVSAYDNMGRQKAEGVIAENNKIELVPIDFN